MKKQKQFLYLVLILLLVLAAYYYFNNQKGTLGERKGALSSFAIQDTTSISKIFIADAKGEKVTLSKKDGKWMVNEKYDARPDNIKLLLKTFYKIDVKMPVSNAAFNNVVKALATNSIKVEIYQGNKQPSKIYYVGRATLNHQGTFMLLEENGVKSTTPYIMHIPGFYGYLTTRFFTNAQQWRDAVVFKETPKKIKQITVTYYETPEESFVIKQQEGQFQLFSKNNNPINTVDQKKLQNYVERYQRIYYEMIDEESSQEKIDSVVSSPPYFNITVYDIDGDSNTITAYHMPNFRGLMNPKEELHPYDVDRMYGYLNNDLFLFIQFATFDQLSLPKSYFFKK